MTATGVTYFLGVFVWTVTAFHGVLSSQAFIEEQFLAPRLFPPLSAFADWHAGIAVLTLTGWAAARYRGFSRPSSLRTWVAAIAWLAATVLLATATPLSSRHTTTTAMLVVAASVCVILLLGLAEWRPCEAGGTPAHDRSRADLIGCLLAAAAVTVAQVGATAVVDGAPATVASDALQTLRLHLLLAGCVFLALSAVRGAAGSTSRPVVAETVLSIAAFAGALAAYLSATVLTSISIGGPPGIAMGLGIGVALAFAVGASGAAEGGVTGTLAALSPRAAERWWGFPLWVAGLLGFAAAATTASRVADWNFVLLRSGVVLTWVLALSAALRLSRRFSDGGARGAFALVVLVLGAHVGLESSVARVQAATLRNPSAKWIAQTLAGVPTRPAGNIVHLLHANTNIPRDRQVSAVDVDLVPLEGTPSATRPHVFMFVVDSLRRDYLSPYNPAVTFTPAIDALAKDSLVFRNTFTQYGATGLSVPSIWVGGLILHKQYVTSFPRMNSLAKLLAHEQYAQWISMDNILDVILPTSADRVPLDAGVRVKNFRLCGTLGEIRGRLASQPQSPVFAYSLPQDIHVSVVTSEGAQSVDDRDYTGFYAPVASRVRRLDACLGEFIDELKARGLYDQSVIVVTSDHGDSLGEEGRMGHAYSLHPEVVRIPLIIHVPPALRSAWTWDEARVAYSTDITPTLYRLLGHEPKLPARFFGESLARPTGAAPAATRARMIAASYGAVYGALLDRGSRYYVFDAIAMRDMAFDLESAAAPGTEESVSADVRERGLKVIGDTVAEIAAFYRFSTTPGSAP